MKFKETNQISSPLKISQSINVELNTCDRDNKVAFIKARESVVVRYQEESVNWKNKQNGGNLFFKVSS